jgi:long-chain acyl-CoA synthetase
MANEMMPESPDGLRLLALFSKNRPEWCIAEQACFMHRGTTVPLYDTLGAEVLTYCLNQTELATVVCARTETAKLYEVAANCAHLKFVVQMEDCTADDKERAAAAGVELLSFADVRTAGRAKPCAMSAPAADTVATFCYTSGTYCVVLLVVMLLIRYCVRYCCV